MKVIGGKKLAKQLNTLPDEVQANIRKVVRKSGDEFVSVARALVPVDTGALRDTIKVEYKHNGMTAVITAGGDDPKTIIQAKAIEGGRNPSAMRGGMEARPFMSRTEKFLAKKIAGRYKRAIKKAVKDTTNGG